MSAYNSYQPTAQEQARQAAVEAQVQALMNAAKNTASGYKLYQPTPEEEAREAALRQRIRDLVGRMETPPAPAPAGTGGGAPYTPYQPTAQDLAREQALAERIASLLGGMPATDSGYKRFELTPEEQAYEDAMLAQVTAVVDDMNDDASWLPLYSGDTSALASLAVCYVNMNAGCDSKRERKRNNYLEAWKTPAPQYCRSGAARFTNTVKEEPILADRLGLHHGAPPMHIPV